MPILCFEKKFFGVRVPTVHYDMSSSDVQNFVNILELHPPHHHTTLGRPPTWHNKAITGKYFSCPGFAQFWQSVVVFRIVCLWCQHKLNTNRITFFSMHLTAAVRVFNVACDMFCIDARDTSEDNNDIIRNGVVVGAAVLNTRCVWCLH